MVRLVQPHEPARENYLTGVRSDWKSLMGIPVVAKATPFRSTPGPGTQRERLSGRSRRAREGPSTGCFQAGASSSFTGRVAGVGNRKAVRNTGRRL